MAPTPIAALSLAAALALGAAGCGGEPEFDERPLSEDVGAPPADDSTPGLAEDGVIEDGLATGRSAEQPSPPPEQPTEAHPRPESRGDEWQGLETRSGSGAGAGPIETQTRSD